MSLLIAILGAILLTAVGIFVCTAFIGAPYVPTQQKELEEAFTKLYKISKKDLLVDLGSGDGAALKRACLHGADSYGIEINSFLIWISRWRLRRFGKHAKVVLGNIYTAKFPNETTVVYIFGDSRDIKRMVKHIKAESARLGRPLYIISHAFPIPGMKPEKTHRAHFLYKVGD